MTLEYSPPSGWCDAVCERCPLKVDCACHRDMVGLRAAHTRRGEDPQDPAVILADMEAGLADALDILRQVFEERGMDPHDLPPLPPPPVLGARLKEAATDHAMAIKALVDSLGPRAQPHVEHAELALSKAFLLGAKAGRIERHLAGEGDLGDDEPYRRDTVPNLLLMEHQARAADRHMARLARAAPRLCLDRYRRLRDDLHAELAPLLEAIPAAERAAFEALVAAGRAPSPFCRVR